MKNNNFITYYSALVLWELYFLDKCLTRVIAYPLNHLSAYFYNRSEIWRKQCNKIGFNSSKEIIERFTDYADSMDPSNGFFPDTNMYFLCVFFLHSTILVISNCVFGFNPCFYFTIVLKSKSLALYSFVVVLLLAFVFEYYFISRKDKAKKLFKQFDKWKQPKRRRMQWLAFGLIVAICGYQVLTIWLFFVNYKLWM
jgi:hypothetical protein